MGVPKGLRPSSRCSIDGTEVHIPIQLQTISNKCWVANLTERPTVKELVNWLADLRIPWVSTPFSEFWVVPTCLDDNIS